MMYLVLPISYRKPIGELNVVLGLEDLGPVSREHLQSHMKESEV